MTIPLDNQVGIYMGDLRRICHILKMKCFITWQLFFQNPITDRKWKCKDNCHVFWLQDAKKPEKNARLHSNSTEV